MCDLAKLYHQVLQVVALSGDTLTVHLNASLNANGPYYSVGVSAPAYAAPNDILGPEVGRASATTPTELLARLAQELKVANPFTLLQPALATLATLKAEIIRLMNNPVITRREKTYLLLNISRMSDEQAQLAIDELRSKIDQRENGTVAVAA